RIEAEWAANSHHKLADAKLGRVAETGERQVRCATLDHGKIGPWVSTDDPAGELTAIAKPDPNALLALNHMMIGQQKAIGRVEDARTGTFSATAQPAEVDHHRA